MPTGIVTRSILARAESKDIHIDAADISEPMLNAFKGILTGIRGVEIKLPFKSWMAK